MRTWMLRTTSIFLFSSLFLTSPASADPHFYVQFGAPTVYPGVRVTPDTGTRGYLYPGYVYPGYVCIRDTRTRDTSGDGYPRWSGHRYYWGGGGYVRSYGRAAWTSGRWSHGGWHGGRGHWHR